MNRSQTALITGASSGIGRELSRIFAAHHYNLILVARDRSALEAVATELHSQYLVKTQVEVCDLSDREKLEGMIERLQRANQVIDVLVNNAGFGMEGSFAETDWEMERSMIDLNVFALVRLTKAFLPQMVTRGSGKILQIGSTAAFQPGPYYSLYFASKAFILSFSEAISTELKGTSVTVTTICPGPVHTGFEKRLGTNPALFTSGLPIAECSSISQYAFQALMAGKRTAVPGFVNRVLQMASTLLPQWLVLMIMVRILRKKKQSSGAVQAENLAAPEPFSPSKSGDRL